MVDKSECCLYSHTYIAAASSGRQSHDPANNKTGEFNIKIIRESTMRENKLSVYSNVTKHKHITRVDIM